jgi:flagellar hook assembly protein FlgD
MIVDYGNNVIFTPEFEILNNQLYVVYDKSNSVPYGDIFISKLDLLSTTFEYNNSIVDDDPIQIYPNPFKMSTWIVFSLNWTDKINLTIKDLKGQTVKTLFEGIHTGGSDNVLWNGTNNQGQQVQPGIYFCFLRTNDYQYVTKIVYAP